MGLFDNMFGSGAKAALSDANAVRRFAELTKKYANVLQTIEREKVRVEHFHIQDNKLLIRGTAPSQEAKNRVWDAIKQADPNYQNYLIVDISVEEPVPKSVATAAGASVGGLAPSTAPVPAGSASRAPQPGVRQDEPGVASSGGAPEDVRSATSKPEPPAQRYVVQEGETLRKISERFYGDEQQFMRIFHANQDKLKDPSDVHAGDELTIPPPQTT